MNDWVDRIWWWELLQIIITRKFVNTALVKFVTSTAEFVSLHGDRVRLPFDFLSLFLKCQFFECMCLVCEINSLFWNLHIFWWVYQLSFWNHKISLWVYMFNRWFCELIYWVCETASRFCELTCLVGEFVSLPGKILRSPAQFVWVFLLNSWDHSSVYQLNSWYHQLSLWVYLLIGIRNEKESSWFQ